MKQIYQCVPIAAINIARWIHALFDAFLRCTVKDANYILDIDMDIDQLLYITNTYTARGEKIVVKERRENCFAKHIYSIVHNNIFPCIDFLHVHMYVVYNIVGLSAYKLLHTKNTYSMYTLHIYIRRWRRSRLVVHFWEGLGLG